MPKRSKEEVRIVARLLRALGVPCDARAVIAALEAGAQGGLWDAAIPLEDRVILWVDYDGGFYHTQSRLESDTKKTYRKLAEDDRCCVLRIRAGAPPMRIESDRCVTPVVEMPAGGGVRTVARIVAAIARSLAPIVPNAFRDRLAQTHARKTDDAKAARVANEVLEELNARYRREVAALEAVLGSAALARKLRKTDGVHTLLETGVLVDRLKVYMATFGFTTTQIVTFVSSCVAARLTDPEFLAAVEAFRVTFGFTTTQMVTFVSNCVAARLTDPEFLAAIEKLRVGRGLSTAQIVTVVSDESVAARLTNRAFVDALVALPERLTRKRVRALCTHYQKKRKS